MHLWQPKAILERQLLYQKAMPISCVQIITFMSIGNVFSVHFPCLSTSLGMKNKNNSSPDICVLERIG